MAPRFSVVTPVYETPADVLRATIRSVTAQTYDDWELCLVDDCSPSPHVTEILAAAADDDPRIRVSRRDRNGGIVEAWVAPSSSWRAWSSSWLLACSWASATCPSSMTSARSA